MAPITDRLLDQLSDEMREIARGLISECASLCEDDDVRANRDLAMLVDEIAGARPLLARFAFTLRSHSSRHSAICALTGGTA